MKIQIRTLACAPTNVAVMEVCSQLLHFLKNFDGQNGHLNRIPSTLAGVVLFGSREQMSICCDIEDVLLENRILQLENCLSPTTGWKHGAASMIGLLEDCVSKYRLLSIEESKEECSRGTLFFGNYLQGKFNEIENHLRSCFFSLFVHLPRQYLSPDNCMSMVSLLDLLRQMGRQLSNGVITEQVFEASATTPTFTQMLIETGVECLQRLKHLESTLEISLQSLTKGTPVRDFCLQNASVVFCTASSSFMLHDAKTSYFDVVVVDEAAELKECESLIPLMLKQVKHALLVGDEFQLPALVQSLVNKRAGFGRSLFEMLVSLGIEKHLLNIQYRVHPSMSLFPNNQFYNGKILDAPNVKRDEYNKNYSDLMFESYAFINVSDGREEAGDEGTSLMNLVEVAVVLHMINGLYKCWKSSRGKLNVGIVSPYTAQVNFIKKKIGKNYDCDAGFEVRVKSIDGFQCQELDVIILSTVRCNSQGDVGFLHDNQRTNAALTGAQHCLCIVGSADTLVKSGTIWSDIVFDAEDRGCLFHATDNEDFAKVIFEIKTELDQLDGLLYPSSAPWKVVFSNDFSRSFARLRSRHTRRVVMQMLLRIAGGRRSKRRNVDIGASSHLAKIYKVAELYLVWSVDLEKEKETHSQIIKLWDLLPLALVKRLINCMDHMFSMYTEAYLERCKAVCVEGMVEVPMTWMDGENIAKYKMNFNADELIVEDQDPGNNASSLLEKSKVNESLVLLKFYALSSGAIKHLLITHDGSVVDIPFELNDQESMIVRFPYSSFILGRSGTGKTTVLTTKLVRMEQLFFVASHGLGHQDVGPSQAEEMRNWEEADYIKQVFITVSPKLCFAVRCQVNWLLRFANSGELPVSGPLDYLSMHDNINKLDDFADIPDNFNELTADKYPLIITFHKFLMMLDGTLNSFFDKFYVGWGASFQQGVLKSHAVHATIQSKEVHFDKFLGSYWPRFNTKLTKNLNASTVFTEIVSHIKGGFGSNKGILTRDEYMSLSDKRFSSMRSEIRERVYDMFLEYEKKKCAAREFDLADFVNSLHSRPSTDGYMGCKMDFIYIDEVQDLTIRQIALLKNVCSNFKEGFVFAGDTAQTIAKGINFCFEDIRSLFYLEFLSEQKGKEEKIHMSETFQLSWNFRTHIGVLKLAQSVIDLLYYYFPFAVDKLDPETSLIHGDRPILLESGGLENTIIKFFGGSQSINEGPNGFGAEQVILVRDDSVKREILDIVGTRALVLTIFESKGLEFQDVLLFNFFGSSPMENKWRVLYGYMENEGILDPSMTRSYTGFDSNRQHLLCSELNQLYVAITRTRQRLWICENSNEYCEPIFDYWKRLGLVQAKQLDSNFVEAMQAASTRDDWLDRGIELFNKALFEMARICFAKAGDVKNEKWARAAGLVELAERIIYTNLQKAQTALHEAAEIYMTLEMPDKAASCYIKLGKYSQAGTIYLHKCGTPRLEDAGDCFMMAKQWQLAADLYFKANCFFKCTEACSRGNLLNMGLDFLERWRQLEEVSPDKVKFRDLKKIRNDYIEECANCFNRRRDFEQMMHFVRAFQSRDMIRKFLKSKNLVDQLVMVEMEDGNLNEALRLAQMKRDVFLEAVVWEKMGSFERATQLIMLHVITKSLWSSGSNGWPPKPFPNSEDLFTLAKDRARKVSDCFYNSICSELYLLNGKPKTFAELWKMLNEADKSKNIRLEFLSLRALIHHLTRKHSEKMFELESVLDLERRFHEAVDNDKVTLFTLVAIWGRWRKMVTKVSTALDEELCSDYLGVRIKPGIRGDNSDVYHALNSNASWIKTCVRSSSQDVSTGPCLMRGHEFILCAESYWNLELFGTGQGVVEKLESLVLSSRRQPPCPVTKARFTLSMYGITEFIMQLKCGRNSDKMEKLLNSAEGLFLDFWDVFIPLDLKSRATQLVTIDDFPAVTELFDEALDQILSNTRCQLTYGQLGRIFMFLLLTAKLPENWVLRIMGRVKYMPVWRDLFASLKTNFDCGSERKSFVMKLHSGLQATYNVDWKHEHDYMSPHCFLFLLEFLMFFASSCLGTVGYMITTRSTLSQIVQLRGCERLWDSPLVAVLDDNSRSWVQSLFEFILHTVGQFLRDKSEIREWLSQCYLPAEYYHPTILRLATIFYLAYVNKTLLGNGEVSCEGNGEVSMELSNELKEAMNSCEESIRLVVLADVFASVGDTLVVISAKDYDSLLLPSNSIFFFCDELRNRDHVMSVLFPKVSSISACMSEQSFADVPSTFVTNEGTRDFHESKHDKEVRFL